MFLCQYSASVDVSVFFVCCGASILLMWLCQYSLFILQCQYFVYVTVSVFCFCCSVSILPMWLCQYSAHVAMSVFCFWVVTTALGLNTWHKYWAATNTADKSYHILEKHYEIFISHVSYTHHSQLLKMIILKFTLLVLLSWPCVFPSAATTEFSTGSIRTRIDSSTWQYGKI